MKIKYNNSFSIPIEKIKIGECFLYKNKLHMKINEDGHVGTDNSFPNLVINLSDNKLNSIADGVTVNKVKSKIVVG